MKRRPNLEDLDHPDAVVPAAGVVLAAGIPGARAVANRLAVVVAVPAGRYYVLGVCSNSSMQC